MSKTRYIIATAAVCLITGAIAGCGTAERAHRADPAGQATEAGSTEHTGDTERAAEADRAEQAEETDRTQPAAVTDICLDLCQEAAREERLTDPEMIRRIAERFGECGYPAVDRGSQTDMTQAEQVVRFCGLAAAGETADITIVEILDAGAFLTYELHAADGELDVMRSCYEYGGGKIQKTAAGSYRADRWNYTEDGYLMFSGVWFSEDRYVLSMSGAEDYAALRVQPLDETCRELNRRYLLPVGYERNNLFLTDWSGEDYGELDFYDVYDLFYPKVNGGSVPYVADGNPGIRAVYQIPGEEFERVIGSALDIDSGTLRTKAVYDPQTGCYEYSPRGFYEAEFPEYPYPEVVGYTENRDGTIALTVHAVFPYEADSCVYAHEVVIRPLEDGGVTYVSNRILPSEENREPTWHVPRLTEAEWGKLCGETEVSDAAPSWEGILLLQARTGVRGDPVSAAVPYSDMVNYERMEQFLRACADGKRGSVTLYDIHADGGPGRRKYIFDGTELCVSETNIVLEGPGIIYESCLKIREWSYSEKGWFCYQLCVPEYPEVSEVIDGSCLIRVAPMTEQQRELSRRCVYGLGYQGNNLLCSDWDAGHLDGLDYNALYEYLYEMEYKAAYPGPDGPDGIPAGEFERLIMTYLPVTAEQLRTYAVYDAEKQTYAWVRLGCFSYAPTFFGTSLPEVTGIRENEDGTVTLTVDAVCDTVLCDDAVITHELIVRFERDGTFQYLGNRILGDGLERIPGYQYRAA